MAVRKIESFPSITEMLGFLTPSKIENAFDSIKVVLKGAEGEEKQIRLLVTEDEFEPILSEKSLIGSMIKGSLLWIPEEPRIRSGYTSFMLSEAENHLKVDDSHSSTSTSGRNKLPHSENELGITESSNQEVHKRVDVNSEEPELSSTDFLLKNRTQKKKINESNLKAFKSGKKENTSFIINKKSQ